MKKTAIALAAAGLLLAGCTSSPDSSPVPSGPKGDQGTSVTEVRLSDGTRCAVMDMIRGVAITCDWH